MGRFWQNRRLGEGRVGKIAAASRRVSCCSSYPRKIPLISSRRPRFPIIASRPVWPSPSASWRPAQAVSCRPGRVDGDIRQAGGLERQPLRRMKPPFTPDNAKQAVLAFDGDVYDGLAAPTLTAADLAFAQDHPAFCPDSTRLAPPLDLIQPYRLEMGTRLANRRGRDLYAFWEIACGAWPTPTSRPGAPPPWSIWPPEEYFKALAGGPFATPVVRPVFQDWSGGRYRIVSCFAKRARGAMARYAIAYRLTQPEGLQGFDWEGYAFVPEASNDRDWVFRRRAG